MSMSTFAARWPVVALMALAISVSCVDSTPGEPPRDDEGATETVPESSTGQAGMTPELRAAYIAAVQSDAGETYRAERDVSGAARFVHLAQGFEATIDGAEVRLAAEAGTGSSRSRRRGSVARGSRGLVCPRARWRCRVTASISRGRTCGSGT